MARAAAREKHAKSSSKPYSCLAYMKRKPHAEQSFMKRPGGNNKLKPDGIESQRGSGERSTDIGIKQCRPASKIACGGRSVRTAIGKLFAGISAPLCKALLPPPTRCLHEQHFCGGFTARTGESNSLGQGLLM